MSRPRKPTGPAQRKRVMAAIAAMRRQKPGDLPTAITTDNGREFLAAEFKQALHGLGIAHRVRPPSKPTEGGLQAAVLWDQSTGEVRLRAPDGSSVRCVLRTVHDRASGRCFWLNGLMYVTEPNQQGAANDPDGGSRGGTS